MFHELQRRGADVSYAKNEAGSEVDFVARFDDGQPELIQVCANIDDEETLRREVRALEEAALTWPRAKRLVLTAEHRVPFPAAPRGITLMAAWQWLLSDAAARRDRSG